MSLGGPEIVVILIVALLVFGPHRLPEIGRQLGKAIREIRKIEQTVKTEISQVLDLDAPTSSPSDTPAETRPPYYGDPTNVPDPSLGERPEAGALAEADDHAPIPAAFLAEALASAEEKTPADAPGESPGTEAADGDGDEAIPS